MTTLKVGSIEHPTSGSLVTINGTAPSNRNLIINGAMQVAQRGAGPVTFVDNSVEGILAVDLFEQRAQGSWGSVAACSVEQSTDAPDGFATSYHLNVTSAGTPTGSMIHYTRHYVEAYNVVNSGWDYTNSNSKLTLSFYVKADHTATYCVVVNLPDTSTNSFVKEYTIAAANTWQRVSFQIPGNSGFTVNNDNGAGFQIRWMLGLGPNYSAATDGVWNTTSSLWTTSNQDNFFDTVGNDLWITGVQLEVGSVATPFEHRSYGDELARCQRYFFATATGTTYNAVTTGFANSTTNSTQLITYPVQMRATPSITDVGSWEIIDATSHSVSAISSVVSGSNTSSAFNCTSTGLTVGRGNILRNSNDATATLQVSAEL